MTLSIRATFSPQLPRVQIGPSARTANFCKHRGLRALQSPVQWGFHQSILSFYFFVAPWLIRYPNTLDNHARLLLPCPLLLSSALSTPSPSPVPSTSGLRIYLLFLPHAFPLGLSFHSKSQTASQSSSQTQTHRPLSPPARIYDGSVQKTE